MNDTLAPVMDLSSDFKSVTVSVPTSPPITFSMDLDAVESTIANLAIMRSHMLPAVPKTWDGNRPVTAIRNPSWKVEYDAKSGDPVLHIREPGFGWLHYVFTPECWLPTKM